MANIHIIIVAAGSGTRFRALLPKQFSDLRNRPVVMRAIDALRKACPQAGLTIVLSEHHLDKWSELCTEHGFDSPTIAIGGSTRWESVRNALSTVPDDCQLVMVHDGARPFPTAKTLHLLVDSLKKDNSVDGAVPVIDVVDSLRIITDEAGSSQPFDRSKLRAVQTPQIFRADLLRKAYELPYVSTFTDDASVMEAAGFGHIAMVEGSPVTFKITYPQDILLAQALIDNGMV